MWTPWAFVTRALSLQGFQAAEEIITAMGKQTADRSRPIVLSVPARMEIISIWVALTKRHQEKILSLFHPIFKRISGGIDAALTFVARAGLVDACEALLAAKAQPNVWTYDSEVMTMMTPLDFAIQGGSADVIRLMRAHGGKTRVYADMVFASNPLHDAEHGSIRKEFYEWALQNDMSPQMDALIEASNEQPWAIDLASLLVTAVKLGARKITRMLLFRGVSAAGLSPELIADMVLRLVKKNDLQLVTLLIHQRAELHMCGKAVQAAAAAGKTNMISLLAEAGSPLEELNEKEEVPIHLAARAGHTDVLRALHRHGCNMQKQTWERTMNALHEGQRLQPFTAMHMAAQKGHTETLLAFQDMFRDTGYDLTVCRNSPHGITLLHIAVSGNQAETIRVCLDLRCDPDGYSAPGGCDGAHGVPYTGTPLHLAANGGRITAMKTLLAGSADINAACLSDSPDEKKRGCTAAHIAAMNDNLHMLQVLADHRADLQAKNDASQTPLDLACSDEARSLLSRAENLHCAKN
eukprot:gnl/MRDRNA2_/MRDRNA2_168365_c0_seq1.p1 gnl/MRDRNA2_/MRDRNA2_168365_c0~~gnl/MRDRNA2_/MRDRNA2_168365_c0_seq1.p1  ORF type:complete len:523 (+),score=99.35 gnl/MRDRNA2_/MRDRNA2_168365_c0_seq1:1214-2782(+)